MKKKNRFITTEIYHDAMAACSKLITDQETKVQYLFHNEGSASGICVLVDQDGKPLLAKGDVSEHEDLIQAKVKKEMPMAEMNAREEVEPILKFKKIEVKQTLPKKNWADRVK